MNKSGLVAEVAKRTGASKAEVGRVLEAVMDVIRERVIRGERVALVRFGTFERRRRSRRLARNPRKPEVEIPVPARDVPSFNPAQEFRDAVAVRRRSTASRPPVRRRSTRT